MMLKKIAVQKFATEKPSTILLVSKTSPALITTVKRPRVKIVIGKVKISKIGFMIVFKNPKTTATTSATKKLLSTIPGSKYAVIIIARARRNQWRIIRIIITSNW